MTTKTTGVEFKRFYNDSVFWPEDSGDTYHEEEIILVDGSDSPEDPEDYNSIADNAIVKISGGIVFGPQLDGNEPSFEGFFKRWRKQQNTISIIVEVPVQKLDAVKDAIKASGGKVLG